MICRDVHLQELHEVIIKVFVFGAGASNKGLATDS